MDIPRHPPYPVGSLEWARYMQEIIDRVRPPENHIQPATPPPGARLAATGTGQG